MLKNFCPDEKVRLIQMVGGGSCCRSGAAGEGHWRMRLDLPHFLALWDHGCSAYAGTASSSSPI